jgi:hypothetical protein
MTITVANLTTNIATSAANVVTGDGVFDDLMEAATAHLDAQFNLGRITGTDYATVYLGAIQVAMQQAAAFVLGTEKTNAEVLRTNAEVTLLAQKEITEYAQTQQTSKTAPAVGSIMGAQGVLYTEQAKGFQWNADQKYLKTILDAWSINVSTAGVASTGVTAINETGTGNINTQIANAEPT